MLKSMSEALYDFMNQENILARHVSHGETQKDLNTWFKAYMENLDQLYGDKKSVRPVFALLKPGPEHGFVQSSYKDLKESGFEVRAENYNIVYIKEEEVITDAYQTVLNNHHALLEKPESVGYTVAAGDIIICGNSADSLSAYFIDMDRYYRIQHFVTPQLAAAVSARVTIQQEYDLLKALSEYEEVAHRKQYLSDWFPRLSAKDMQDVLEVSHDETVDKEKMSSKTDTEKVVSHDETVTSKRQVSHHETPGKRFSDEAVNIANHTNIVDLVRSLGYTTKRIGKYVTLAEMDSIRIYSSTGYTSYSRFSDGSGGTAVDFLMNIEGKTFREAVTQLLEFNQYTDHVPVKHEAKHVVSETAVSHSETDRSLQLPAKATNYKALYAYLIKTRGFSKETVDYFVKSGLIYEADRYHNVVFLGKDKNGTIRHAFQRGTITMAATPFKRDVAGSDKNYGFNVIEPGSSVLAVFEAAIDLMSYWEVAKGGNMLALGGTADNALERFLEEHPEINCVGLMLDNDEAGTLATKKILEKFSSGKWKDRLTIDDARFLDQYKDWNERMIGYKKAEKERANDTQKISGDTRKR